MRRSLSFRARIILLVVAVALVPLALVGWWLAYAAARSGETLLRQRLVEALDRTARTIGPRWVPHRSALLSLGELDEIQRTLSDTAADESGPPAALEHAVATLDPAIQRIVVLDASDNVVWTVNGPGFAAGVTGVATMRPLPVRVSIHERGGPRLLGAVEAHIQLVALVEVTPEPGATNGAFIAVVDPATGASLSTPLDPTMLRLPRFHWGGEDWVTEQHSVREPRLDLVAAAPLTPFVAPFEDASRSGLVLLTVVGGLALTMAVLVTGRLTRSLSSLAASAEAVSRGDLTHKTRLTGSDEVARVGHAFDVMTENLQRTLAESAQREALVAVGTFASELAHEVRNPLTAIRLDLQVMGERLGADPSLREVQQSALHEVRELEKTVTGVLQLARSGKVEFAPVDAVEVARGAVHSAMPEFERCGARSDVTLPSEGYIVFGDAAALRQLFLNLLLNAAQSLERGGVVYVSAHAGDGSATFTIRDDGPGMTADILSRVREPFFTTKHGGTGLGLALCERIVRAHRGELEIESAPGHGTIITVRLALASVQ